MLLKLLTLIVAFLVVTGLFRKVIHKLRLGRLPGDILIQRGKFRLYLPVTTSILVGSAAILLIWLMRH
ncbi:Protein of unknown function [Desulfonatronum thiosulfatophilum]|uniref:DUF2905 domain-containing protein n=1 Tax=Desulfonatronum thiosulfatophilum TaxID=617002 RepID=A0A1G6B7L9_9BACT|nr:DUF2905 domain-containing protein [Desulfonatronum thiosulfatophilum]SDB16658.1 Protein of unknown function [Desulfonatronum thiosulfatophilum]